MSAATEILKTHNWFVLIKDIEDIEYFIKMLKEALNSAKQEDKIIKARVQQIDIEDSF